MKQLIINSKKMIYNLSLVFTDLVAYFVALFFAYITRLTFEKMFNIIELQFDFEYFVFDLWWIFIVFMALLISSGLYNRKLPFWKEAKELAKSSTMAFVIAFAIVSIGQMSGNISRLTLLFLYAYSTFFLILFRFILKEKLHNNKYFSEKAIVVGDGADVENIAVAFSKEHNLCFNIKGIVNINSNSNEVSSTKFKNLGNIAGIEDIIKKNSISVVIFVPNAVSGEDLSKLTSRLQLLVSKIVVVPDLSDFAISNAEVQQTLMTQISYFQINNNLKSLFNRFLKRSMDILICILALPFFLFVVGVIALLIKLGSDGPIFFAHNRVGRNGKVIKTLKFRSMYKDAKERLEVILKTNPEAKKEWEATYKLKNDPRVTKVGRFLRKSSLDELPQVFNVIMGDMSLIGPRPVIQEEIDKYYKDYATYYLMVRPGITGLWQISGRNDTNYDFRVARDTWYVLNWSLWLDLTILLKTPLVVLLRKGAY